jgi:hypothetical protein
VIAGLGAWNLRLRSEQDDLRQVVAQRDAAIAQFTRNGPAQVAALTSGTAGAPRRATVVVRGDTIEVITETLPGTTGDVRYWLWTLTCDNPAAPTDLKPISGFQVSQSEFSVRSIRSDPALAGATCFAISREVGSATPTAPAEVVALGRPE